MVSFKIWGLGIARNLLSQSRSARELAAVKPYKGSSSLAADNGSNTVRAGATGSAGNIQVQLGNGNGDMVTLLGNGNDQVILGNGIGDIVSINGNGNENVQVGNGTGDMVSINGNGNETVQTGAGTGQLKIRGTGKKNLHLGNGWTQI